MNGKLAVAAALALGAYAGGVPLRLPRVPVYTPKSPGENEAAMAKAQLKRDRNAAKRLKAHGVRNGTI